MKHTESTDNAVFWAAPVLLGLLMTFGGLLAGACLLSAGTMLTAGWSARRAPANRFVLGFLTGLSLLGCLFLLSLTLRDAAVQAVAAGILSGTAIASALTGAILGAAAKTKKRRR